MAQWKAQVGEQVALNIFSKSPAAIGQVCSTATTFRAYRTNNDLEYFWSVATSSTSLYWTHWHHPRVIRGSVQFAAIATQLQAPRASDLSLFLGLLGSRSQLKNINNGFNSDNFLHYVFGVFGAETSPASFAT